MCAGKQTSGALEVGGTGLGRAGMGDGGRK